MITSISHEVPVRRGSGAVQRALKDVDLWLGTRRVLIGGVRVRAEIAQLQRRLDLETLIVAEHAIDTLERVPQAECVAQLVNQVVGRVRSAEVLRLQRDATCRQPCRH